MEKLNKVALDTNMLMAIGELKIDVFEEIEKEIGKTKFFVPGEVIKELKDIKKKGRKKRINAEIAEKAIKKECVILKNKKKTLTKEWRN
jgi:rRNA-processing protein FCF1